MTYLAVVCALLLSAGPSSRVGAQPLPADDERALRVRIRATPDDSQALADLALLLEQRGRVGPAVNALQRLRAQDARVFERVGGPAKLEALEATLREQAAQPAAQGALLFETVQRELGGMRALLRSRPLDGVDKAAVRAWHASGEPVHEDRPVTIAAGAYFRTRGPVVDDRFHHDAAALHEAGLEAWAWLDVGSLRGSGVPPTPARLRRLGRELAAQGADGVLLDERSVRGGGEELLRTLAGAADSRRGPAWGIVLRPWDGTDLEAGLAAALDSEARWIVVRAASPPRAERAECEFIATISDVLEAQPGAGARVMLLMEPGDREHVSCRAQLAGVPRASDVAIHGCFEMPPH